ncbi:hypothetical protein F444_12229, partial [Phytophthora nicotianae P1976]
MGEVGRAKKILFAHVDDLVIRAAVRYKAMDRATFLKRMTAPVGVIDIKISKDIAGEIVADNMETNKAIARRVDVPLVGCATHRFNLVVRERLEPHMKIIKK